MKITILDDYFDTVRTLREDGPRAIGDLLVASHESMRDDFEITVPQVDVAAEAAEQAMFLGKPPVGRRDGQRPPARRRR